MSNLKVEDPPKQRSLTDIAAEANRNLAKVADEARAHEAHQVLYPAIYTECLEAAEKGKNEVRIRTPIKQNMVSYVKAVLKEKAPEITLSVKTEWTTTYTCFAHQTSGFIDRDETCRCRTGQQKCWYASW